MKRRITSTRLSESGSRDPTLPATLIRHVTVYQRIAGLDAQVDHLPPQFREQRDPEWRRLVEFKPVTVGPTSASVPVLLDAGVLARHSRRRSVVDHP